MNIFKEGPIDYQGTSPLFNPQERRNPNVVFWMTMGWLALLIFVTFGL